MRANHRKPMLSLLAVAAVLVLVLSAACSTALPALQNATGQVGNVVAAIAQPDTSSPAQTELVGAGLQDPVAVVAAQEMVLNDIYQTVLPSVVHIQVAQQVGQNLPSFQFPQIPGLPFSLPEIPQQPEETQPLYQRSEGSGFVWDREGHIVTNNHVVAGADTVKVIFSDGSAVDATVLGTDPNADLAVVKVDLPADQLNPVGLGDSDALLVGQMAVAIGNPFGLENTMTYGIVSALGRTIASGTSSYSIPEVIQTDAPINPGNSGGPLLDRNGQVIGINTQIVSRSGSNAGIGFAVPINIAKRVVPQLISEGRYDYAWLGISGQTLSADVAKAMNLPEGTAGALVITIAHDGPADKAGLAGSDKTLDADGLELPIGGDVITSIAGQPVAGMDDLISYLTDQARPGDRVQLEIIDSAGKTRSVTVTLGTRPSSQEQAAPVSEESPQQP